MIGTEINNHVGSLMLAEQSLVLSFPNCTLFWTTNTTDASPDLLLICKYNSIEVTQQKIKLSCQLSLVTLHYNFSSWHGAEFVMKTKFVWNNFSGMNIIQKHVNVYNFHTALFISIPVLGNKVSSSICYFCNTNQPQIWNCLSLRSKASKCLLFCSLKVMNSNYLRIIKE